MLWLRQGLEHIQSILEAEAAHLLEGRQKQEKREGLPELKNVDGKKPVFRFAPNPNGPLSFGHARGIVINGTYSKNMKEHSSYVSMIPIPRSSRQNYRPMI